VIRHVHAVPVSSHREAPQLIISVSGTSGDSFSDRRNMVFHLETDVSPGQCANRKKA